jgi:hypothetical protein
MSLLSILDKSEAKELEKAPKFAYYDRVQYFKLPKALLEKVLSFEKSEYKVIFILMYGYFKATNRFISVKEFVNSDIEYILDEYQLAIPSNIKNISLSSRHIRRYKSIIKRYFHINNYTIEIKTKLMSHAKNLASCFTHRKKIFYSLVQLARELNIEMPSTTELLSIITDTLNKEKTHILTSLETLIDDPKLKELEQFIEENKNYKNRYNIHIYKKLEHATSKKKMTTSVERLKNIKSIFHIVKPIIDEVGITTKIASYWAMWVQKSDVFQLTRKNRVEINFLLLCFVYHQYQIRTDNLVDRFISTVQSAKNSSNRAHKDALFEQEPVKNRVIQSLEDSNLSILNDIKHIIDDSSYSAMRKIELIEKLLHRQTNNVAKILEEKKALDTIEISKYDFIEEKSISLQGKLSNVLKHLEFDEQSSNKNLIKAINHFRDNPTITKSVPMEFLKPEELDILSSGKFRVSLYKILLFFHVSDGIKSGILNLKYSYKRKDFDK